MIEFSGVDTMNRKLEGIRRHTVEIASRRAVLAGAKVIAAAMAASAPVRSSRGKKGGKGTPLDPGEIKADIRARGVRNDDGEAAALAGPTGKTAFVANWVEWGHREVTGGYSKIVSADGKTRGPGRQIGEVNAQPFLRPAFDAVREEAEEARDEVLRAELEEGKS